jgi:hypothetical protein
MPVKLSEAIPSPWSVEIAASAVAFSGRQCGWLKDRFGVSWQIVPSALGEIMTSGDQAKIDRVTQVLLPMKKFDIAALMAAAENRDCRPALRQAEARSRDTVQGFRWAAEGIC